MIGPFLILLLAAPQAEWNNFNCEIWLAGPTTEVTSQSSIEPRTEVGFHNQNGQIRIHFERSNSEIENVEVILASDPMYLASRKQLPWRGRHVGEDRFYFDFAGHSTRHVRWISLDRRGDGKFDARWSFVDPFASQISIAGSGFGICELRQAGGAV